MPATTPSPAALATLRNFGISAHIDSGKTTLSERILFYTGRIHRIEEVKGDGDGATMDSMELEKERGITIQSAATSVRWRNHVMNLIDTPGHVDFTIEVERSLRVLDGAVLVLCAVGGVQPQSITVDRQMKRYAVPRLAFVNKMDRAGADARRVLAQLRSRLGLDCALVQLPIGAGDSFAGCVDLVRLTALRFAGDHGEQVCEEPVPGELAAAAAAARRELLEQLAMHDDELMETVVEGREPAAELVQRAIRDATWANRFVPVLVGSAYRNIGVQPLLDAIAAYLPSPLDRSCHALDARRPDERLALVPRDEEPLVAMGFKIVANDFGVVTYVRIYQGRIAKGDTVVNQRTGKSERVAAIYRMHADTRETITAAGAGDIVGLVGLDAASGDTYAATPGYCALESMFVPEPVIRRAISPVDSTDADRLGRVLQRFRREDPTFRVTSDPETGELLVAGMGELHLEIYCERIRREERIDLVVGPPKVSYREAATRTVRFDYRHRKQGGGRGQYAHIVGTIGPAAEGVTAGFVFEDRVVGGRIPRQFIPAVEKGFRTSLEKGPLARYPVTGLAVTLEDGSYHEVDSSERAFQTAAEGCFREYFPQTEPVILEPIMKVEIECPEAYQGAVAGDLAGRRGVVVESTTDGTAARLVAEVPLASMVGYATEIRGLTQGQGTCGVQEQIIAERRQA